MPWKQIDKEYIIHNKWISIRKDHVLLPTGVEIDDFYVIERPNLVHIIAITADNHFILEKQYRYAINRNCYELCAGIIEHGETPLEAAKRELIEETGYSGGLWEPYGEYAIDPNNMTDISYAFVAKGVEKSKEPMLDTTESLSVEIVTKEEIIQLMRSGMIVSGLMLAPLWRFVNENKFE